MELFKNSKLLVVISDDRELIVSEKSGILCSKDVDVTTVSLTDVIAMSPYGGDSCVAIATTQGSFNLKMNREAVSELVYSIKDIKY